MKKGTIVLCAAAVFALADAAMAGHEHTQGELKGVRKAWQAGDRPAEPVEGIGLQPRQELPKLARVQQPSHPHQLVVKFHDCHKARATESGVVSLENSDFFEIKALEQACGAEFRPLLNLTTETISLLERRAARASNTRQPDLAAMMVVDAPADALQVIADILQASDLTEWVQFVAIGAEPPCTDKPPITPDLTDYSEWTHFHHRQDPGMSMDTAWRMGDARGTGVKIVHCEYSFNPTHEDLCNIVQEPGQTMTLGPDTIEGDHGTAALGIMVAGDNGYGVTGLVPDADAYFYTELSLEEGPRRATAVANAIALAGVGDVVVLEMQTRGPVNGAWCPAEYSLPIWTLTKNGTDAGVVVVAAAGNGGHSLDDPAYSEYLGRGDSGAIIVGGGSSTLLHDRDGETTTCGSRVNLQGWSENVPTAGQGRVGPFGDIDQRYTPRFGGTSSATPMVAAACVAVQSFYEERTGARLLPLQLRNVLVSTGIPQGWGTHDTTQDGFCNVGPFPDVPVALASLFPTYGACCDFGSGVCSWGSASDCTGGTFLGTGTFCREHACDTATRSFAIADYTTALGVISSGSYWSTRASDGVYEVLAEEVISGPVSALDHTWIFRVPSGSHYALYVDAYRPTGVDHDDFAFSYSLDGTTYTPMVRVGRSASYPLYYMFPEDVSDIIFVRVEDTRRRAVDEYGVVDRLYVDHLYIEVGNDGAYVGCGDGVCESPEDLCDCPRDCGPSPAVEVDCFNWFDDDCDGLADCSDPDCSAVCLCGDGVCSSSEDPCTCPEDCGNPPTSETGSCGDGVDNDCDRFTDCDDPDCAGDVPCTCGNATCDPAEDPCSCPEDCGSPPSTETDCSDAFDNDCDGDVDCDDPDCLSSCCGNGTCDVPHETPCDCVADCGPVTPTETNCNDGIDNDCDGVIDCADPDCASSCAWCGDEVCGPGEDACNCRIDCGQPASSEISCTDGIDNDCDTYVDCDDTDCLGDSACDCGDSSCASGEDQCNCPEDCGTPPANEVNCSDGIDNDCDALIDCDDPDCASSCVYCGNGICDSGEDQCNCSADCGAPPVSETICDDGIDNDCDALIDCADADCTPSCTWCGDEVCDPDENPCNCRIDCGRPPRFETDCFDGEDNDCDGYTDCDDRDCRRFC